jgi:hypothetical protein
MTHGMDLMVYHPNPTLFFLEVLAFVVVLDKSL